MDEIGLGCGPSDRFQSKNNTRMYDLISLFGVVNLHFDKL